MDIHVLHVTNSSKARKGGGRMNRGRYIVPRNSTDVKETFMVLLRYGQDIASSCSYSVTMYCYIEIHHRVLAHTNYLHI